MGDTESIEAFIARWSNLSGSVRANDRLFITELCRLLALPLPLPEPAREDARGNACTFERRTGFSPRPLARLRLYHHRDTGSPVPRAARGRQPSALAAGVTRRALNHERENKPC